MPDPWAEFLARFAGTLARPSNAWSEAKAAELWRCLAEGPVGKYLYAIALNKVRNKEDAEEVVQQLLFELLKGKTYDPTGRGPDAFRTWLHGCFHNHLCKFYTKRKNDQEHLVPLSDAVATKDPRTDGDKVALQIENDLDATPSLAILSARERQVVILTLQGKTDDEIVHEVGITQGNLRVIRHRANQKVRKRLTSQLK